MGEKQLKKENNNLTRSLSSNNIQSCLRSDTCKKSTMTRNVSFPEDDNQIVTGILEPESPWKNVTGISNEDLISMYVTSCEKHGTIPIQSILNQLKNVDLSEERNECLSLKGIILDAIACETLEEILKHVQFNQIDLESTQLDDESCVALFDMLEYYESAMHLNISSNDNIGVRGWQACSRMIKKALSLEELDARNTTLNEVSMPILGRALTVGSQLQVLKLENCNLAGKPIIILASALKCNENLKELYLAENNLGLKDASQLGAMLKCNTTLQLLDISHNNIMDVGLHCLVEGITHHVFGLSVFIVWNNQLTKNAATPICKLMDYSKSLLMLNIGQNVLGDEFVRSIESSVSHNDYLLRLGMQTTYLTNEVAFIFTRMLIQNTTLQRIDLRDNNIQVSGLESLLEGLKSNMSMIRLDLDKRPRKCDSEGNSHAHYELLASKIAKKCKDNERIQNERRMEIEEKEDTLEELLGKPKNLNLSIVDCRKISLTCDSFLAHTRGSALLFPDAGKKNNIRLKSPAPSPMPSPISSPSPVRSRFQVFKVPEEQLLQPLPPPPPPPPAQKTSRFKVEAVDESGKKCESKVSFMKSDLPNVTSGLKSLIEKSALTEGLKSIFQNGSDSRGSSGVDRLIGLFQIPFTKKSQEADAKEDGKWNNVDSNYKEKENINWGDVANVGNVENETEDGKCKVFPATWPQVMTASNTALLSSPCRSSPSLLGVGATALVILQGSVSTDITGGLKNMGIEDTVVAGADST